MMMPRPRGGQGEPRRSSSTTTLPTAVPQMTTTMGVPSVTKPTRMTATTLPTMAGRYKLHTTHRNPSTTATRSPQWTVCARRRPCHARCAEMTSDARASG